MVPKAPSGVYTQGAYAEHRPLQIGAKLIFLRRKGTFSALEALRDALYKSTTTTTTVTSTPCQQNT